MSSAPTTPSSSAVAAPAVHADKLRSHLQSNPLKFHLKTGNSKWQCTLIHRNELERQRAMRTDSSTSTTSTNSSASSIGSH